MSAIIVMHYCPNNQSGTDSTFAIRACKNLEVAALFIAECTEKSGGVEGISYIFDQPYHLIGIDLEAPDTWESEESVRAIQLNAEFACVYGDRDGLLYEQSRLNALARLIWSRAGWCILDRQEHAELARKEQEDPLSQAQKTSEIEAKVARIRALQAELRQLNIDV